MRFFSVLFLLLPLSLAQVAVASPAYHSSPIADSAVVKDDGDVLRAKAPAAKQRIAVLDMVATGEQQETAKMLTEVLSVEASRVNGLEVIGMGDIAAVIGFEQQKQLIGCTDDACLAEIGGALGVRAILSSKIGKVGDTYVLSMRLVDTQAAKLLGSVYKTVPGKPDALISAVQRGTPELLAVLAAKDSPAAVGDAGQTQKAGAKAAAPKAVSYQVAKPFSLPAWPGYVVIGLGGAAVLVAGGLAAVAVTNYPWEETGNMPSIGGNDFVGVDAQAQIGASMDMGVAGAAFAVGGVVFIVAGLVYENFAGVQK